MTRTIIAGILAAVSVAGCGLISSDITDFDLRLQPKSFTVDTSDWGVPADQGTFPEIPCSPDANTCADVAAAYCDQGQCAGSCDAEASACAAEVGVSLSQPVNLVQENTELETLNNQPFLSVTIDAVEYMIEENTLSFDTPELRFYVAPLDVMTPDSPEARLVGTIAPVPAGQQLDWTAMTLTPEGEANLREFMGNYRSIFNVLVGAQVGISGGDQSPSGAIKAWVRVRAHAGL